MAGHEIAFARETRYPETVNHVAASQIDRYLLVNRNVNLVRRRHAIASVWIGVGRLPPPLMSDDIDNHGPNGVTTERCAETDVVDEEDGADAQGGQGRSPDP